jgi:site-specific recombinase XerD
VQRHLPTWKSQRQRVNAQDQTGRLRRFWDWLHARRAITTPTQVTLTDLRTYQTEQLAHGQAPGTINRTLDHVLGLLRQQAEQGQPVEASVFRLRRLPRPASLPRSLSEADSQRLDAHLLSRLERPEPLLRLENACFAVLAYCGLRASECLDLQVQDVDVAARRLTVRQGKGQRDRVVYLTDLTAYVLTTYLGPAPRPPASPFWLSPAGRPLTYPWLYQHLAAFAQAAGVPAVTPHRLRHTFATRLLNAGLEITRIQKLLGHQHLTTTMIYARVLDPTLEADYRLAMQQIERRTMPLSTTPLAAANWPRPSVPALAPPELSHPGGRPLDNSI